MWQTKYEALLLSLANLEKDAEVEKSEKLLERIQTIRAFLMDLKKEVPLLTSEAASIQDKINHLRNAPNELIVSKNPDYMRQYEMIRDLGGSPYLVAKFAEKKGVKPPIIIELLGSIFDLSEAEAKAIYQPE